MNAFQKIRSSTFYLFWVVANLHMLAYRVRQPPVSSPCSNPLIGLYILMNDQSLMQSPRQQSDLRNRQSSALVGESNPLYEARGAGL